jgi:dephospho-CoA kinase
MKRVGLTGNIGSGKSTVAGLLARRGAAVIDADALAREATAHPHVLGRIRDEVGPEVVTNGTLDRARLAALVFEDEAARRRLEAIIHPWVRTRGRDLEEDLRNSPDPPSLVVHDVPLLFESGLAETFDLVVVVSAPKEARAARTATRSNLSYEDFSARDRSQWPLERKVAEADYVLDNSGDLASLEEQVDALWSRLLTS